MSLGLLTVAALAIGAGGQADAPAHGQCRPDPAGAAGPEATALRFHDLASRQDVPGMAALITEDSAFFNGGENIHMTDDAFLAILGVGQAGRTPAEPALISGGTVVLRQRLRGGAESLIVVRVDGGCVASVATFYD